MKTRDNRAYITLIFWYLWTKNFLRILSGAIFLMRYEPKLWEEFSVRKVCFLNGKEKCKSVFSKCATFVYVVIATLSLNILAVYDLAGQSPKHSPGVSRVWCLFCWNDQWVTLHMITGLNRQSAYEILYFWIFL